MRLRPLALVVLALCLPSTLAQTFVDASHTVLIDPERGVDPKVDYAALVRLGPWDDRNYQLTREDLAVLPDGEAEQLDPIPAFFRVGMRKARPDLPRTGPGQYPRSALQIFREMYGGYLVDGTLYRATTRVDGRFEVLLEDGLSKAAYDEGADFVSGEVRVTSPNGAAEAAIKVSPADTNKVIAGSNGPGTDQKMHYSTNGGSTWTQVSLPLGGTCCDPAVDWSSTGAYAYAIALGGCGFFDCQLWFYRSADGGKTWTDLQTVTPGDPRREVTTRADKCFMHVDKFPGSPYKERVYLTWHQSNVMQFAVSSDFGNTFTTQAFSNLSEERGIGSDIATDRSGNVYYVWPGVNSRTIRVRKSTNGGQTFGNSVVAASTQASFDFPVPSMETRNVFVYVSADADLSSGPFANSIYVAWTDSTAPTSGNPSTNHARIQVARSRDGGATWAVTTPHETADALAVDRWHPWLAVGPDGAVHVIYYDTRRDPTRRSVDLFYSYSTDGAVTWSAPSRVTTVQSPNIQDGFEFGDYNGLDIVMQDLITIFTDNRRESGGTGDSVDVYAAGIPPGSGPFCGNSVIEPGESCDGANLGGQSCLDFGCSGGVLACASDCGAFDTAACVGCAGAGAGRIPGAQGVPGTPLLLTRGGAQITLNWSVACGPATDYAVYEGTLGIPGSQTPRQCSTGGLTSTTLTPAAGQRFYLVVAESGGAEGSYGRKSDGTERAPSASPCLPQQIGACP